MRVCPFDDCGEHIPEDNFACLRHWVQLAPRQQQTIRAAYADYLADNISINELRTVQQGILDVVQKRRRGK